ncbi:hypothetical protein FRB90_000086 [Tulasnella sp. 427]|nr:hypothetical protein FRB90_000086 [Tulasnella sp. 427]
MTPIAEPVSDITVLSVKVEAYSPTVDGSEPCANYPASRCPHEARVILKTNALCVPHGFDLKPKFMTRVSWPASFPVDADFIVNKEFNTPLDTGESGVNLGFRARSRGQPNPYVATTGVTDVPFIVTIERLLFGTIPGSILPLIGFILAGAVTVGSFANQIVFPGILELARQAEEESHSNSKQE